MLFPKGHGGLVLFAVHGDPAAAMFLPEGVAHHGDGLHGGLEGLVLSLDGDDAPLGGVGVGRPHGLVLDVNLIAGVQDQVKVLGRLLEACGDVSGVDETGQNRELVFGPGHVRGLDKGFQLGGELDGGGGGDGEVFDENVLAEGGIALNEDVRFEVFPSLDTGADEIVDLGQKLLLVVVHEPGFTARGELAGAEGVDANEVVEIGHFGTVVVLDPEGGCRRGKGPGTVVHKCPRGWGKSSACGEIKVRNGGGDGDGDGGQ